MRTRFTRLGSAQGMEKGMGEQGKWMKPKPSAEDPSKGSGSRGSTKMNDLEDSMTETNFTREEDILPLQNFDPSIRADIEHYPRGDDEFGTGTGTEQMGGEKEHYPRDGKGNERRVGLHLPGDLSTNRPGRFKRLDSEAKVGGGAGMEEVEDRI